MYRITLVVDDCFGRRVLDLAQTTYVWLVESTENDLWAKLACETLQHGGDPLLHGVSTFRRERGEDLDSLIIRVLDMIDEHHGEFAHEPEWSEIEVLGASPSSAIEAAAIEYGVARCEPISGGFRLFRPNSLSDEQSSG